MLAGRVNSFAIRGFFRVKNDLSDVTLLTVGPTSLHEPSAWLHIECRRRLILSIKRRNIMEIGKWSAGLLALWMLTACAVEVSAQGGGGRGELGGHGGRPNFDRLLGAFDANEGGALEEDETPTFV